MAPSTKSKNRAATSFARAVSIIFFSASLGAFGGLLGSTGVPISDRAYSKIILNCSCVSPLLVLSHFSFAGNISAKVFLVLSPAIPSTPLFGPFRLIPASTNACCTAMQVAVSVRSTVVLACSSVAVNGVVVCHLGFCLGVGFWFGTVCCGAGSDGIKFPISSTRYVYVCPFSVTSTFPSA